MWALDDAVRAGKAETPRPSGPLDRVKQLPLGG
jgi:hypothetical protein